MDELGRLKQTMLAVTQELVSGCRFCLLVSDDPECKTPVQCLKYSGTTTPVHVNVQTCLSCQEFKGNRRTSLANDLAADG